MITQKELKESLCYEKETGLFFWIISKANNRIKPGDIAGTYVNGYIKIIINKKAYFAHRLAWLYVCGEWPKHQIDHINQIKDDNRFSNLRDAMDVENKRNRTKQKNNTSGVNGVSWYKRDKKWFAYIKVNGKQLDLGRHKDRFEAICARKSAENKHGFHLNHGMSK